MLTDDSLSTVSGGASDDGLSTPRTPVGAPLRTFEFVADRADATASCPTASAPQEDEWRGALTDKVRAHIRAHIASFETVPALAKRDSATLRTVAEEVLAQEPLSGLRSAYGIVGEPKRWQHYAQRRKKSGGVACPWLGEFMQAVLKEAVALGLRVEPDSGALRVVGVPAIRKLTRSAWRNTDEGGASVKKQKLKPQKGRSEVEGAAYAAAQTLVALFDAEIPSSRAVELAAY